LVIGPYAMTVLAAIDERLLRFMRQRGHAPTVERKVRLFSMLGEHGALWLAIGTLGWLADRRNRSCWVKAIVAVVDAYALNTAIKLLVRRRRPQLLGLPPLASTPTQLSFPSAHTATAFAGALAYSRLGLPKAPLYCLAAATGLSRPYLGLHHPSDVLAGAALGTAVAAAISAPADRAPAAAGQAR
jgi:membrane-associated phospholipid phosphatase